MIWDSWKPLLERVLRQIVHFRGDMASKPLFIALGEILGTYINALMVTRIGYIKMMFVGFAIMLFASIVLLTMSALNIINITSIAIPSFLVTVSIGITIPNATAGAFSQIKNSIGSAGAIYGFFQILITIIITFIISRIENQNQLDLGFIFLGLSLASVAIYSFIITTMKKPIP